MRKVGKRWRILLTSALLMLGSGIASLGSPPTQQAEGRASKSNAVEPKLQPIAFSHKVHSAFFPDCLACHKISPDGQQMSYPPEAKCMECHVAIHAESPAIVQLAGYYKNQKPVPWVRVCNLPDEVFFSHKRHSEKGKIGCSICHGPVAQYDVITPERATWMNFCIDCHKDKKAPANCRTCHNR
jgi:hypothetical protein